jgi:hypothetical protein
MWADSAIDSPLAARRVLWSSPSLLLHKLTGDRPSTAGPHHSSLRIANLLRTIVTLSGHNVVRGVEKVKLKSIFLKATEA